MTPQPSRNVRLVQCLCPSRHCIIALAFTPSEMDDEAAIAELKGMVAGAIAGGQLNPWCAPCQSRDWRYEARPTKYATMDEAAPRLLETMARNLATRDYLLGRWRQDH